MFLTGEVACKPIITFCYQMALSSYSIRVFINYGRKCEKEFIRQ